MATKLDRSKLVRNLANRSKLVPHLDKVIGEGDFEWTYRYESKGDDKAWHPSMHCTPSPHELYHIATNPEPEKISSSLYKTFQVGHFWHQYLQHLILHKLAFCGPEAIERAGSTDWGKAGPPEDWNWVNGHGDVAPCEIPEHGQYLVDFKTMKSIDFKHSKCPAWTAAKWECQVNIYMDFFDLDQALILGILKDSPHDFKEFEFKRNQPLIDAIYEKWALVSLCIEEEIEPPEDAEIELPLRGPQGV